MVTRTDRYVKNDTKRETARESELKTDASGWSGLIICLQNTGAGLELKRERKDRH